MMIIIIINRNNIFDTKIRRQQGRQKLTAHYLLNDRVQNPNRNNSQKNLHTFGRAELTATKVKRMSHWK